MGIEFVDTDYGDWIDASGPERLWREDRIGALLDEHRRRTLFVARLRREPGAALSALRAVVLLSAPVDVILERVAARESNDFGRSDDRSANRSSGDLEEFEPLLRAGATAEIDTRAPLTEVANELEQIATASW